MFTLPPCPHCGSKAVMYEGTLQSLVHVPLQTDESGRIMSGEPAPSTDYYRCKKCGKDYKY